MNDNPYYIVVYEHEWLRIDKVNYHGRILPVSCYDALCSFYGEKGVPYYDLIYKGIKFCEYVGVIRVGKYTIEILPKADKSVTKGNESKWQRVLICMLLKSGNFPVTAPTFSNLHLKKNSILELYIQLFLNEVQRLIHEGLIKKYRKTEGNLNALKGRLLFNEQLQINLIHAERFYTSYTTYNYDHIYNQIVYSALELIPEISSITAGVYAKQLKLFFPDMDQIKIDEATFTKLKIDRKTERYKGVITIARLLLLNYHPDISKGRNHVLALMFDINNLWEKYVLNSLKEAANKYDDLHINGQESEEFWNGRTIRPDIVVRKRTETYVIDTKWKILDKPKPSVEDVRQMYAYNHHFKCSKSILLYPDVFKIPGIYSEYKLPNLHISENEKHGCGVVFADVVNTDNQLNAEFGIQVLNQILKTD